MQRKEQRPQKWKGGPSYSAGDARAEGLAGRGVKSCAPQGHRRGQGGIRAWGNETDAEACPGLSEQAVPMGTGSLGEQ